MKMIKKYIVVLVIACILEVVVFNFSYIFSFFNNSTEYNQEFYFSDFTKINWNQAGDEMVSGIDAMLVLENVNANIGTAKLSFSSNKTISNMDLFYTDKIHDFFSEETLLSFAGPIENETRIHVNTYVKDIRIDLSDEEGIVLTDMKLVVNYVKFDFSISRLVAILLIYIVAMGLFSLQKTPNYET